VPEDYFETLASRIQILRKTSNMSQAQLGVIIGKDQQYVSKLENGVISAVPASVAMKLASALDCSMELLIYGEDAE
jgi:transcriptional regulator with XRE-family HTH domain